MVSLFLRLRPKIVRTLLPDPPDPDPDADPDAGAGWPWLDGSPFRAGVLALPPAADGEGYDSLCDPNAPRPVPARLPVRGELRIRNCGDADASGARPPAMAAALGEKADRLEAETTMGVSFRVELEGAGWE